ncbi:flagellar hook-basal body complex protein FliE [Comamonadaceae bacterium SL12-8]|uniref:Flagellar hook-basal body complex protein FliE n=2 Tax=Amphibiibacter pelophylacis TaxID=1799477 RepID=A0ACC6NZM1_9BURK
MAQALPPPSGPGASAAQPGGFRAALTDALGEVSAAQGESRRMQQELQLGNPAVSLEDTMVAMQKSQIGFQAVLAVRNRLVQSYSEIMNMQV